MSLSISHKGSVLGFARLAAGAAESCPSETDMFWGLQEEHAAAPG